MIHLAPQTLTVRRETESYVDHLPVRVADSTFTITADVQKSPGTDRQDLPEGYRTGRILKLYTDTADVLRVIDVATGAPGDLVEYEGSDWEVIHSEDHTTWPVPIAHWKYIISRQGVDE